MMVSKSYLSPIPMVGNENSDLFSVLNQHFGSCMNKARIKLISMFLQSLIKVQTTVNFNRLANSFESNVKADSSLRRIQRFFADYFYDVDLVARLIFALIPSKENSVFKLRACELENR